MRGLFLMMLALISGVAMADVLPVSMRVYPTPQEVALLGGDAVKTPQAVKVVPEKGFDKDALRALKERFAVNGDAAFAVRWEKDASIAPEGYKLVLGANDAAISASTDTGIFYAVQTLKQLLQGPNYLTCAINDWPVVPFRGTVEGYYGQPFSAEARKDHFRFYGQVKLNTFIYGPKDDPYHGFSTQWRDPYPADKAKVLAEMVKVAAENKVNFVWAVHPGRDIQWKDDSDIRACLKKFEMMYALGVRSFAVFFDDIGGEGARAEKQVLLMNTLNREFVRKKGDVTPLIICPTDYNRSWAGPKYLDILGDELDDDIEVMWTGNSVCTDITSEGIDYINGRIDRKAYIWWNWPVNDYCRSNLLLGPAYGNALTIGENISGFVSNPMEHPEASKIGLFGVADYTWNPRAYSDPYRTWEDGIRRLFPNMADAVMIFANNNSDQGWNGHGYRRLESVGISESLDRARAALLKDEPPHLDDIRVLFTAFCDMRRAAEEILERGEGTRFVEETRNWLEAFKAQAEAGIVVCRGFFMGKRGNKVTALRALLLADAARKHYSDLQNKTPFPSAVEPASLHVQPMLNAARTKLYHDLYKDITGKTAPEVRPNTAYKFITNVEELKGYSAVRTNIYVRLPEIFETKTLNPGDWVGLQLPPGILATWVHFKLENKNAAKQGQIEVSSDFGKTWRKLEGVRVAQEGAELQRSLHINKDKVTSARFINVSNEPLAINFKLFKLDVPKGASINLPAMMVDGDPSTGYAFKKGEVQIINVTDTEPNQLNTFPIGAGKFDVEYDDSTVTITAEGDDVVIYEIIH